MYDFGFESNSEFIDHPAHTSVKTIRKNSLMQESLIEMCQDLNQILNTFSKKKPELHSSKFFFTVHVAIHI